MVNPGIPMINPTMIMPDPSTMPIPDPAILAGMPPPPPMNFEGLKISTGGSSSSNNESQQLLNDSFTPTTVENGTA